MQRLHPTHPGRVLQDDFLKPLRLSQNRLARELGVDPRRVNAIVLGKRAMTPDTAARLAARFGTSGAFWMNLQAQYDYETATGLPVSAAGQQRGAAARATPRRRR